MSALPKLKRPTTGTGRGGVTIYPNRGLHDVKAGDTILVTSGDSARHRRTDERVVERVARSNLYVVLYGHEVGFGIDDGIERRGSNAIGSPMFARTAAQVTADEEREEMIAALRDVGINLAQEHAWENRQLAAIINALAEEQT